MAPNLPDPTQRNEMTKLRRSKVQYDAELSVITSKFCQEMDARQLADLEDVMTFSGANRELLLGPRLAFRYRLPRCKGIEVRP